jgi:chemotaxis protein CheD
MTGPEVEVRIAELKAARAPGRFVAYGLGSCVGITLYDPKGRVGGMAHVMLPESRLYSDRSSPGKFADTAIDRLIFEMGPMGSDRGRLEAKLVGGATMFAPASRITGLSIGLRNVMAAREHLTALGIPVVSEDVGGKKGRTIFFDLEDGSVSIRSFGQPMRIL